MSFTFNSSKSFFGGASILIQYHDLIRSTYLMAIIKMILNKEIQFGLPFEIISQFSKLSLVEWYKNRTYFNPLQSLDIKHQATQDDLDKIMLRVLNADPSLYKLAPILDTYKMIFTMFKSNFDIPLYIYSQNYEPGIQLDIQNITYPAKYIHGDLSEIVPKIPTNSTYIFADIELLKKCINYIPQKTSANIILSSDYGYNLRKGSYKYNIGELLMKDFKPFILVNNISIFRIPQVLNDLNNLV